MRSVWFNLYCLFFATVFVLYGSQRTEAQTSFPSTRASGRWISSHFLKHNPDLPFSFRVGGAFYGHEAFLSNGWQINVEALPILNGVSRWSISLSQPTLKLKVNSWVKEYPEFEGVEWGWSIENSSRTESPIITDVRAADYNIHTLTAGDFQLNYSIGDKDTPLVTPPGYDRSIDVANFQPMRTVFTEGGLPTSFSPFSGRSSRGYLPYFNLEMPDGTGAILAIGWTGTWEATFSKVTATTAHITTRQKVFHAQLLPGEIIVPPSTVKMFWRGTWLDSQNAFRQFMLAYFSPKTLSGDHIPAVIAASPIPPDLNPTDGIEPLPTETHLTEAINNIAGSGVRFNTLWMDAGWYRDPDPQSTREGHWFYGVGDWTPDPVRFSRGMAPISERAQQNGMDFLLWFEPERFAQGSENYSTLMNSRPEWLLLLPDDPNDADNVYYNLHGARFNLGNPAGREWLTKLIGNRLKEYGVKIYRQDMNGGKVEEQWVHNDTIERSISKKFLDTANAKTTNPVTIGDWSTGDSLVEHYAMRLQGDGSTDLLQIYQDGGFAYTDPLLSDGTNLYRHPDWRRQRIGGWSENGYKVEHLPGDYNGDGRDDLLQLYVDADQKVHTDFLFGVNGEFVRIPESERRDIGDRIVGGLPVHYYPGDFNSDGKTDILQMYSVGGKAFTDLLLSDGANLYRPAVTLPQDIGDWFVSNEAVQRYVVRLAGETAIAQIYKGADGLAYLDILYATIESDRTIFSRRHSIPRPLGVWRQGGEPVRFVPFDLDNDGNTELLKIWRSDDGRAHAGAIFSTRTPFDDEAFLTGSDIGAWHAASPQTFLIAPPHEGQLLRLTRTEANMVEAHIMDPIVRSVNLERRGITEAKHIEGLYKFFKDLMAAQPGLVIDNCAAGGRRLDINMSRLSLPLWRTDDITTKSVPLGWDPSKQQNHTLGLSLWLPLQGGGSDGAAPNEQLLRYKIRSGYFGHMVFGLRYDTPLTERLWGVLREEIPKWNSVKNNFSKAYYPLIDHDWIRDPEYISTRNDIWVGWQFGDDWSGLVQAFRRKDNLQPKKVLKFKALQPEKMYTITNPDYPSFRLRKRGIELMQGLEVSIPDQFGNVLLRYERGKSIDRK